MAARLLPFSPPALIGHRGAAALAPENTLASIRAAAAAGVAWIEIDAKLARDGVPVLMHDDTLDRTTNRTGPAAALTSAELGTLDAGGWFDPAFAGESVPTLTAALAECRRLGLGLDLEIKPDKGTEAATATAVVSTLAAAGWSAAAPLLLSSFAPESLRAARAAAPELPRGLLIWKFPKGWQATARELEVVTVIPDQGSLRTPADVTRIRSLRYPVITYTVNAGDRARQLRDWGVAGIVTDDPPALAGG